MEIVKETPKIEILWSMSDQWSFFMPCTHVLSIGYKIPGCPCCKRQKPPVVLWHVTVKSGQDLELLELALESMQSIPAAQKFVELLGEKYEKEKRS